MVQKLLSADRIPIQASLAQIPHTGSLGSEPGTSEAALGAGGRGGGAVLNPLILWDVSMEMGRKGKSWCQQPETK